MTNLSIGQHRQTDVQNSQQNADSKRQGAIFASMGLLNLILQKGQKQLLNEMKNLIEIGKTSSNAIKHGLFKGSGALNEGFLLESQMVPKQVLQTAITNYKGLLTAEKAEATASKHDKTEAGPKSAKA